MDEQFKIYTSYWGNMRNILALGLQPVGISQYPPHYLSKSTLSFKALAPSKELLYKCKHDADFTDADYTVEFERDVIGKLNAGEVFEKLKALGDGKSVAILCYEKPPDFCHRNLVASWLQKVLGIKIEEVPYKK